MKKGGKHTAHVQNMLAIQALRASPLLVSTPPPRPAPQLVEDDTDYYALRFDGVKRLFGSHTPDRLRAATVVVVGVGGVGSWAVEALARSGVGSLVLVDLDEVCISVRRKSQTRVSTTRLHAAHALVSRTAEHQPAAARVK